MEGYFEEEEETEEEGGRSYAPKEDPEARAVANFLGKAKGERIGWVSNWRPEFCPGIRVTFHFFQVKLVLDRLADDQEREAEARKDMFKKYGISYIPIFSETEVDGKMILAELKKNGGLIK